MPTQKNKKYGEREKETFSLFNDTHLLYIHIHMYAYTQQLAVCVYVFNIIGYLK